MSFCKSTLLTITTLACVLQSIAMPTKQLPTLPPTPPQRTHYTAGEDITLACDADGTLSPIFHWLHNGNYVEQGPLDINARNLISSSIHHLQTIVDTTLVIKNAKPEDSGKYTCIADSLTKRVVRSFTITVTGSTTKKTAEQAASASNLRIYQHTKSIMQNEDNPIYAICRATQGITSPVPTIRWSVDGVQLEENDGIKIHSNGDIEISAEESRKLHFMFELRCTAIGHDGLSTVNKEIFVYMAAADES